MKLRTLFRFGTPALPSLLGWMLAGGLLYSLVVLADSPSKLPMGDHGAVSMDYQMKELSKLQPNPDLTKPPAGFDPVIWEAFIPDDNKPTPERIDLGRKLYFDTRLSRDGTVSCATCHDVIRGFTDQRASLGGNQGPASASGTRRRRST